MRIDVHAHYNPPIFVTEFERRGGRKLSAHKDGLDHRVEMMDAAGIDIQILSLGAIQPYFLELQAAAEMAKFSNNLYKELIQRHPQRFMAFGSVPLPHVDQSIAEVARLHDDLGFAGVSLGCSAGGLPLDNPKFDPFWQELDRRGAVVFIHPGTCNSLAVGIAEANLAVLLGNPAEITIAAVRLALSAIPQRFPRIRIILASGGGTIPYMWGRLAQKYGRHPTDANTESPDVMGGLKTMYYDTAISSEPGLMECVCEHCGISHLILGCDAPAGDMLEVVNAIRNSTFLTQEQTLAVLERNAGAILGLNTEQHLSA